MALPAAAPAQMAAQLRAVAAGVFLSTLLAGCGSGERSLEVTATAYTHHAGGALGTWDNPLPEDPDDQRTIAVSRDLYAMGLRQGTRVRIAGRPGVYTVQDLMPAQWKRRIDIYMGGDRERARDWGRRTVEIQWTPPPKP